MDDLFQTGHNGDTAAIGDSLLTTSVFKETVCHCQFVEIREHRKVFFAVIMCHIVTRPFSVCRSNNDRILPYSVG